VTLVRLPDPLKSADAVLHDAFALLGCERLGGASVSGWSRQSDLLRCPYRYFLKHERHLAPTTLAASSKGQDTGSFIHAFLAAHYARLLPPPFDPGDGQLIAYPGWHENSPTPDQLRDACLECGAEVEALMMASRLWENYLDYWGDDNWIPVAVEMPAGDPALHTSRYDLVFFVEDGLHDGLWIGEHKSSKSSPDLEQWDLDGEVLGEMLSWQLSDLDSRFGAKLNGVCINVLIKTKVPSYFRIWKPVDDQLVREFHRTRLHWSRIEEVYRKSGVWPKSLYGCKSKYDVVTGQRCGYWDHCLSLSDQFLTPMPEK